MRDYPTNGGGLIGGEPSPPGVVGGTCTDCEQYFENSDFEYCPLCSEALIELTRCEQTDS